jgi:hypothetical protein
MALEHQQFGEDHHGDACLHVLPNLACKTHTRGDDACSPVAAALYDAKDIPLV